MKDHYIQIIKDACVKANTNILKLGFGCEALYHDEKTIMKWVHYGPDFNNFDGPDCHVFIKPDGTKLLLSNSDVLTYKILGHPIRLSDILHTLGTVKPEAMIATNTSNGVVIDERLSQLLTLYNFLNDTLEGQSEECLKFISELLSEK